MGIAFLRRAAVQFVVLDRQEALNALSPQMIEELVVALDAAANDPQVRAIVITGAGRAFCAGADIAVMADLDVAGARAFAEAGHGLCNAIVACPVPVIAAINGFALGGGCEVSLACDIRIASDTARIALPEVSLGIAPGWGGTQRLARVVGEGFAKQMILTARMVSADEALAHGLVTAVHAPDDLLDAAAAIGDEIASRSPSAVARAKALVNMALGDPAPGLSHELEEFAQAFGDPERREGMQAFLEKRAPVWPGD
ncbi:MAG: enoyl-CoA hydratase-related protein [Actinomycetota bacterium]|nr:enoyl-CoA hydratase-related protein [Actinomycetota bacterium]